MLRENKEQSRRIQPETGGTRFQIRKWAKTPHWGWRRLGLPAKLLVLTAVFVMLAEILIFVPSVSDYRLNYTESTLTENKKIIGYIANKKGCITIDLFTFLKFMIFLENIF